MHPVLYSAVGLPHHRNKYEISNIVRSKLSSREDLFVIFQYVLRCVDLFNNPYPEVTHRPVQNEKTHDKKCIYLSNKIIVYQSKHIESFILKLLNIPNDLNRNKI